MVRTSWVGNGPVLPINIRGSHQRLILEATEWENENMVMYGPMQLIVIGFPGNEFSGEVLPAIKDVRDKGLIRLIDYVFVMKDADGIVSRTKGTEILGPGEVEQLGAAVGALIGLGAGGAKGARKGAEMGAERGRERELSNERTYGLSQDDINEYLESVPNKTSALFAIVEHLWAKDLKQAVMDSNGNVLIQGMLRPELFVRIGEALPRPSSR